MFAHIGYICMNNDFEIYVGKETIQEMNLGVFLFSLDCMLYPKKKNIILRQLAFIPHLSN